MMIPGEIGKEGHLYFANAFSLHAYGQGRSRRAACESLAAFIVDVARYYAPLNGFRVQVTDGGDTTVYVTSNQPRRLLSMFLRAQRGDQGMTLADVASATGAKSRTAYAQYEQSKLDPSIVKLQELLDTVAPDFVLAIVPRAAAIVAPEKVHGDEKEIDALLADPSAGNVAAFLKAGSKARSKRPARRAG